MDHPLSVHRNQGGPSIEEGQRARWEALHLEVARVAQRQPAAIALRDESGAELRYDALWERVEGIAAALRPHLSDAAGGEPLVGLCLPRSVDLPAAMLACFVAGAGYVPLDPAFPASRLKMMVEDARPAVLLTAGEASAGARELADHASSQAGAEAPAVVSLEALPARPLGAVDAPAPSLALQRAYVLFTSGSTGRPKGVEISHGALHNFLSSMGRRPGFTAEEALLAITTLSFDIAQLELLLPLLHGGQVWIASSETAADGRRLADLLERWRPSAMQATPAGWRQLLDAGWAGDPRLRALCGGEALPPDLAARLLERCAEVWNLYGPTETTVWSSVHRVSPADTAEARVSVGEAIARTTLQLGDFAPGAEPAGGEWDLWIGGAGLARGYLGQPRITAEVFRPDPWAAPRKASSGTAPEAGTGDGGGALPGARRYRTGDLARRRADGALEVLGRRDHQVKLRGFRIELDEISAALRRHRDVADAVTVLGAGAGGAERLVAYVTGPKLGPPGAAPRRDDGSLARFVSRWLPSYMVPAVVVHLSELPLTPNRKVDRRRLPEPPASESLGGEPQGETEIQLAAAMTEVLALPAAPGRQANFLHLGGDSLSGTRLLTRLREHDEGWDLTLAQLFEHPTVVALARCLESASATGTAARRLPLDPLAREPLEGISLKSVSLEDVSLEGVPPGSEGFPLSSPQERLWVLDRVAPGAPTYNELVRLCWPRSEDRHRETSEPGQERGLEPESVEPSATPSWRHLERAWGAVVARHEILRTVYPTAEDGSPRQLVVAPADLATIAPRGLPVVDLEALPGDLARRESDRLARAWGRRPFRLDSAAPWRVLGVASAAGAGSLGQGRQLLLALHHIAYDLWSLDLLVRDLGRALNLEPVSPDTALASPEVRYGQYAAAQRRVLAGAAMDALGEQWEERLTGAPELLQLPWDRPRPALPSFRGGRVVRVLDARRQENLEALARGAGASLFMVSLAAFHLLLARLSGSADVVVSTPIAGRRRRELEEVVGFFANTLALRVAAAPAEVSALAGEVPAAHWLAAVRSHALWAFERQDLPFERLVERLAPRRDPSYGPVAQVMLAVQDALTEGDEGGPFEVEEVFLGVARFDLSLFLRPRPQGGLELSLVYAEDLFDATTASRWLGALERLLTGWGAAPGATLQELPWMSAGEAHQVTVEWPSAVAADPLDVLARFATVAQRQPDELAVSAPDGAYTYGELASRAFRLATVLGEEGVGLGDRLGLYLERRRDLPALILASLALGAAWVPLDPTYPSTRLRFMAQRGGCRQVVVGAADGPLPFLSEGAVVSVPEGTSEGVAEGAAEEAMEAPRLLDLAALGARADWLPEPRSGPRAAAALRIAAEGCPSSALAYVIFTSGSTGQPKGVAIHRGALAASMAAISRTTGVGSGEIYLHTASFSFSSSVRQLFSPLTRGGTVVLASRDELTHVPKLIQRMVTEEVSLVDWVPSYWRNLHLTVESLGTEERQAFADALPRTVLSASEPLLADLPRRFRRRWGQQTRLINMFGQTETTGIACATAVPQDPGDGVVVVGRPLPGVRVHLLDARLEAVPPGVVGEVHVGGPTVGLGYLQQPAVTAAHFLPDPFGAPGGRLYRAGDLARRDAGGVLHFLGRRDHQIKVRGFRVELGEVETLLARAPGVAEAAVVAWTARPGDTRLAAYVVATEDSPQRLPDEAALRAFLGERLPDTMVPSSFHSLESLPRTTSGKLDRRALPQPGGEETSGRDAATDSAAAVQLSAAEEVVLGLFREILGTALGPDDDFFAHGGHSLSATRLVSRLAVALAVEVALPDLFRHPRPRQLAAQLERRREGGAAPLKTLLEARPPQAPLEVSDAQERLWLAEQQQPGSAYNSLYLLRLEGALDRPALLRSLRDLLQRHGVLRTRFQQRDGRPHPVMAAPESVVVPVVDLSALPVTVARGALEGLASRGLQRPFDLASDALLQPLLVALPEGGHRLLSRSHHIVFDGGSQGLFLEELERGYSRHRAGRGALPRPSLGYADYAHWHRRWLAGPARQQLEAHWRQALEDLPPAAAPPPDHPAADPGAAATLDHRFPTAAAAVRRLGHGRGATLFTTVLATLQLSLGRWSAAEAVTVAAPVANREHRGTGEMIGMFANTVLLGGRWTAEQSFENYLTKTRDVVFGALGYQDLPFEDQLALLSPQRRASAPFRVLVSVVTNPEPALIWDDLEVRPEPIAAVTRDATFDLVLGVFESEGRLQVRAEYASGRYRRESIQEVLDHWGRLIAEVVEDPSRVVGELAPLSAEQRRRVEKAQEVVEEAGPDRAQRAEVARSRVEKKRDQLSGAKRALLAKRLGALKARRGGKGVKEPAAESKALSIPRRPEDAPPAPLSHAQQRLWFLEQLRPGQATFHVPLSMRLGGELKAQRLAAALGGVVERHQVLRTVYQGQSGIGQSGTVQSGTVQSGTVQSGTVQSGTVPSGEGPSTEGAEPRQRVCPAVSPFPLPVVDLSALASAARERELRRLADAEERRPFDLAAGPMLRSVLLRLSSAEHGLLITVHHIACDAVSVAVLLRELAVLYGSGGELPPLAIQYADYAQWQRQWLEGKDAARQLEAWRSVLDPDAVLELPTDRPRPAVQRFVGDRVEGQLGGARLERLRRLAQRFDATPFMVLLAVFQVLMARLSGQRDVTIGTFVANRGRMELQPLVGFLVNNLAMRLDLDSALDSADSEEAVQGPSFRRWLTRVQAVASEAYTHQELPFEILLEALQPARRMSHTPIFQVMCALQRETNLAQAFPGLTLERIPAAEKRVHFDLSLLVFEGENDAQVELEYASDLFDASTAQRLLRHTLVLLDGALENPSTAVLSLPWLTAAQSHQLLLEVNDGARPRRQRLLHGFFTTTAAERPGAFAARFGEERWTYRQLELESRRLALRLRDLGVGPDTAVGLAVERSVEMVLAVLAVLRAGGTCVPLDPAYPAPRLQAMVEDAAVEVLVVTGEVPPPLRGLDVPVVTVPPQSVAEASELPELPEDLPSDLHLAPGLSPHHRAYVIFTSGSTGRPKGIGLSHEALANLVEWHLATLRREVPMVAYASLSFDASFHEFFATWGGGGELVIVEEALRRDVPALVRRLADQEVVKMITPVVVLHQLAEEVLRRVEEGESLPPLEEITSTGEALQVTDSVRRLFQRLPQAELHNHYGPSETHVVTAHSLKGDPENWPVWASIGRPIDNSTVYVLDALAQPLPLGVWGELYLGGLCLARGYEGRPGLTAERFVPDPFDALGEGGGQRLYRTGDIARVAPDGTLDFAGRRDHQVKIRGFRVELGEIEAVLVRHPRVAEAVVLARPWSTGELRLAAYLVLEHGLEEGEDWRAELRRHLQAELPDYMVPATWIALDALPLTSNRKVDRDALPDPEGAAGEAAAVGAEPPATPTEERLVALWGEVLGLETLGVTTSFFDLGGHSLLATRLLARVRQALGVELELAHLFTTPTVRGLGETVDTLLWAAGAASQEAPQALAEEIGAEGVEGEDDDEWEELEL